MNSETLLAILQHGNQLKRTARTGWVQRGVPDAENVAAHSYGVAFTALVLAQTIAEPVDLGKLLTMALLHDLPEGLTSDIPRPVSRFFPAGFKETVEAAALAEIFDQAPFAGEILDLWAELTADSSTEAKLVHDADRLELYLQAHNYARETGNQRLAEFWAQNYTFHFPQSTALYDLLRAQSPYPK